MAITGPSTAVVSLVVAIAGLLANPAFTGLFGQLNYTGGDFASLDIEEAVKPLPAEGPSLEAVEKEPVSEDASFWKQHCEGLAGLVLGTALGVFLGRRSRAEAVAVADEETPVAVRIHRRTASYPLSDGSSDEEDFLFQSWRSRVD